MALWKTHPREDLLRYVDGVVEAKEKQALEEHLETCKACRDYISLVKSFNEGLSELGEEEFTSKEPCPDSSTLVSYEAGKVDERTARHLRAHLLFCDDCQEEFYALRRLSREESWHGLLERLREFVVDLSKQYSPGTLIGSVKIVGEQLAFATRGERRTEPFSKAFELEVGENTYSIQLSLTSEGSLSYDIAGYKTPRSVPLKVSVLAETGEELFATETDEHGNTQFVLDREEMPRDICVLVLTLDGSESYLPFRIPEQPVPS